MPPPYEKLILPDVKDLDRIDVYEQHGGYGALRKALSMRPEEVTDEVKKSNLKGRGGACFPTGLKWSFMPKQSTVPKYLCANGDEGDPGAYVDRYLMEDDPHCLIEGMILAGYAVGPKVISRDQVIAVLDEEHEVDADLYVIGDEIGFSDKGPSLKIECVLPGTWTAA